VLDAPPRGKEGEDVEIFPCNLGKRNEPNGRLSLYVVEERFEVEAQNT
jgi:hypothetical protein